MTTEISARAKAYNYADFPPKDTRSDFEGFRELLKVGQQAPDFEATTLDGQRVRLSDYLAKGPTAFEFGSIT